MYIIRIAALGILQGITEFLPISSSGHLIILPKVFGWEDQGLAVDIFLHMGTLLALLTYFHKDIIDICINKKKQLLLTSICLASVPVILIGYSFSDFFASGEGIRSMYFVAMTLIIGAVILLVANNFYVKKRQEEKPTKSLEDMGFLQILYVGLMQILAYFPGVSRSGITIAGGLFTGISRSDSARLSFLVGIPVILGLGTIGVIKQVFLDPASGSNVMGDIDGVALAVGFFCSYISGYLAIDFLIKFLQRASLLGFVIYRLILGVVLIYLTLV